jgi:hypothetical protein
VLRQFHGVVQYPTHHEKVGHEADNQEVARPPHDLRTRGRVIPAQSRSRGTFGRA